MFIISELKKEILTYFHKKEYISDTEVIEIKNKLKEKKNLTLFYSLFNKYVYHACPNCKSTGFFKWHFWGKLVHPNCDWYWYSNPRAYIRRQFNRFFKMSIDLGVEAANISEKEGKNGVVSGILGFIVGIILSIPIVLTIIPIQAILYFDQRIPNKNIKGDRAPEVRINFGALFLTPLWLLFHRNIFWSIFYSIIYLLALQYADFGLLLAFQLGFGIFVAVIAHDLLWKSGRYNSLEEIIEKEKKWNIAGFIALIFSIVINIVFFVSNQGNII